MKINNITMTAEASRDAELFFVFFLWLCIKYSWLRPDQLSLFADGGNDTKVIRLSRTRAGL